MTRSAHDVAAELRRRLPGVSAEKLHKLLYYCQAHHLAHSGEPLFGEAISAWDIGPVVGPLWKAEHDLVPPPPSGPMGEAALNTVAYVVSRYGGLTNLDLEHLTRAETPWQQANHGRSAGDSAAIEQDVMRQYFRAIADAPEDGGAWLTDSAVARLTDGAHDRAATATADADETDLLRRRWEQLRLAAGDE